MNTKKCLKSEIVILTRIFQVNYNATDEEIKNVIRNSDECKQDITFKCNNSPFMIGRVEKAWWTGIDGNFIYVFFDAHLH